jgi:adenylate cyclase
LNKAASALGLGIVCATLALAIGRSDFAQTVELKTYDARMRVTADAGRASPDIVLVTIDEDSLRRLEPAVGRWPWPRLVHAELLNFLARAPARVVAYDVLFTEGDIRSIELEGEVVSGPESDAALAEATSRAGAVIHMADVAVEGLEAPSAQGEEVLSPRRAPAALPAFRLGPSAEARPIVRWPYAELSEASRSVAHNFFVLDPDGPLRRYVPFVSVDGIALPSLGVAAALAALDVPADEVRMDPQRLWIRDHGIPVVEGDIPSYYGERRRSRRALLRYVGGVMAGARPTYQQYSFYSLFYSEQQLLAGVEPTVNPSALRDKIVFVGATAPGLHDVFSSPFGDGMPGAQVHAAVADDILSRRTLRQAPAWTGALLTLVSAVTLAAVAVFLGPWAATAAALVGCAALLALVTILFGQGIWVPAVDPVVAVTLATFGGVTYQYVIEGREKRRVKRLFSRYVSPDVYTRLLQDPSVARLGGERRMMSVLFSDIRGFTTVSEQGQPEDILGQLNEYFSRMVPLVFEHRGTIDKFVGDMIMALFGAPVHDERHAEHAVATAVAMVRELEVLNESWAREGKPRLDIGIGVNSGEMVAGNVGSESIMSYTVIGDQVNLGARLESLNKEYGTRILISGSTRQLLGEAFQVRPLGAVTVKGKTKPVDIFEVLVPRVGES